MSALLGRRFCASAEQGANATTARAAATRSSEGDARWAGMAGVLTNDGRAWLVGRQH